MTDRQFITDLKRRAQERWPQVLGELGIHARPRGNRGTIALCDPMTPDSDPSLVIWTAMPGGISFVRYGSEAKGDVINLVAYLRGWWDLPRNGNPEATRWLADLLGLRSLSKAERDRDRARARRIEHARTARAAADLARDRRRAFGMWAHAEEISGTRVELYLEARGIRVAELPRGPRGGERLPSVLRFIKQHDHVDARGVKTAWPCMIAGCVDYANAPFAIGAVHRTWLRHDGGDKAPVEPARKCWPAFAGLVIPLWRGGSNLSVGEAIGAGLRETLVITEGIEDGLTAALARPDLRVWAAISLNNIGNVPLPECIDSVLVHQQSDWHSRQAIEAFEHAIAELAAQGRPVSTFRAFGEAKDINEMVKEEASS